MSRSVPSQLYGPKGICYDRNNRPYRCSSRNLNSYTNSQPYYNNVHSSSSHHPYSYNDTGYNIFSFFDFLSIAHWSESMNDLFFWGLLLFSAISFYFYLRSRYQPHNNSNFAYHAQHLANSDDMMMMLYPQPYQPFRMHPSSNELCDRTRYFHFPRMDHATSSFFDAGTAASRGSHRSSSNSEDNHENTSCGLSDLEPLFHAHDNDSVFLVSDIWHNFSSLLSQVFDDSNLHEKFLKVRNHFDDSLHECDYFLMYCFVRRLSLISKIEMYAMNDKITSQCSSKNDDSVQNNNMDVMQNSSKIDEMYKQRLFDDNNKDKASNSVLDCFKDFDVYIFLTLLFNFAAFRRLFLSKQLHASLSSFSSFEFLDMFFSRFFDDHLTPNRTVVRGYSAAFKRWRDILNLFIQTSKKIIKISYEQHGNLDPFSVMEKEKSCVLSQFMQSSSSLNIDGNNNTTTTTTTPINNNNYNSKNNSNNNIIGSSNKLDIGIQLNALKIDEVDDRFHAACRSKRQNMNSFASTHAPSSPLAKRFSCDPVLHVD